MQAVENLEGGGGGLRMAILLCARSKLVDYSYLFINYIIRSRDASIQAQ
jgi:hypothetical protein